MNLRVLSGWGTLLRQILMISYLRNIRKIAAIWKQLGILDLLDLRVNLRVSLRVNLRVSLRVNLRVNLRVSLRVNLTGERNQPSVWGLALVSLVFGSLGCQNYWF